jgi:hypothetical protein
MNNGETEMIQMARLFPNPAANTTAISMRFEKNEHVVINVVDIQGREVIQALEKNIQAGQQQISFSTSRLNNGVYFVKLSYGKVATEFKLVVSH